MVAGDKNLYKVNWSFPKVTERALRKVCTGEVLNFPCGMSRIGLRVDLDTAVKPDVVADLRHPPFRNLSFDTVLCDPPASFFNKIKWILKIADLSRKKFILWSPFVNVNLSSKRWKKDYFLTSAPNTLFIRFWIMFTKPNKELKNYW